ncbi:penicillin-binding protein 2 [Bacteroidales bacterium]|nr:penicillin-binding protein 2 [Bacteroidales bacterium]
MSVESNSNRKFFIVGFVLLLSVTYIVRLFYIQVIDVTYKLSAENNSKRRVDIYPARGLIYDRNGELLVYNQAAYDLMCEPLQLSEFDTLKFCDLLGVDISFMREELKLRRRLSYLRREPMIRQISDEMYARYQEYAHRFPGFYVQKRTLRKYGRPIASHVLGYVGEVGKKEMESDAYEMHDYIGKSGIEKTYEKQLRGEKGMQYFNVDVLGRIKGRYSNGQYDKKAKVGNNLVSTIDADLQEYGEFLMQPFKGSIVAIEPSTGEILTMISAPSFNPELLVGRVRSANYRILAGNDMKPLYNRAISAKYPPGSTFKLLNGLVALDEHVNVPSDKYPCYYGFHQGRISVACHGHESPLDLIGAIKNSCNAYFNYCFKNILEDPEFAGESGALDNWQKKIMSFGFGSKLNTDLSYELSGYVPGSELYDRIYGENHWRFVTVRSLSIGQGEISVTPVQLTNMTAAIANKGFYYIPHIVKQIEGQEVDARFKTKQYVDIDTAHFTPIIEGMSQVVNGGSGGTATHGRLKDIEVCGKTGTAENPHGEDHSIFVAFAPRENPKIAIMVYVENGGFGSKYAVPISSLMIEKYLTGTISRNRQWWEQHILTAKLEYHADKKEE